MIQINNKKRKKEKAMQSAQTHESQNSLIIWKNAIWSINKNLLL